MLASKVFLSLVSGWILDYVKGPNKAAPRGFSVLSFKVQKMLRMRISITKTGEDKSAFSSTRTLLSVCVCACMCVSMCRLRLFKLRGRLSKAEGREEGREDINRVEAAVCADGQQLLDRLDRKAGVQLRVWELLFWNFFELHTYTARYISICKVLLK